MGIVIFFSSLDYFLSYLKIDFEVMVFYMMLLHVRFQFEAIYVMEI